MLALLLLAVLAAPPIAPVGDAAPGTLEREISRIADDSEGTLGVSIVDVATGRSVSHSGSEKFPMASVFKLPVAVVLLRRVDAGALRLDEKLPIGRGDLRPPGPVFERWKPGLSLTVGELLDDMMVASDNSAVDLLIRRLGGTKAVREGLFALGLSGIDVDATELEVLLRFRGITGTPSDLRMTPEELKKKSDRLPAADRKKAEQAFEKKPRNAATPDAFARLLVRLEKRELLSAASTERLLSAMRQCATGDRRIRAGVPRGSEVLDKTGTIGRCVNDVGLVRIPGGPTLAIAVFLRSSSLGEAEREAVAAKVAKAAAAAFGR
ncbi:MAG: class A beta-lactamase [Acidithiobacillales bacterium]